MIRTINQLCELIQLQPSQLNLDSDSPFPLKVPKHFANQIEPKNPQDPLLLQILPMLSEREEVVGFNHDPVGDLALNPIDSLLHKYKGRVLLITSPKCDIHCRYCFRRHFPYEQAKKNNWRQAFDYIQQDSSINEVILSGGDPFALSEPILIDLLSQIEKIKHIDTLRIHSRTPVVMPEKANRPNLIARLKVSRLSIVLVVHCNHANELTEQTHQLFKQYKQAGITLLNQSVLLKDVNDSVESLTILSKKLFKQGVLPYYCHLLDKVAGASHFSVKNRQGWGLLEGLKKQLPGYLVPKFVVEIAGEPYKTQLLKPENNVDDK